MADGTLMIILTLVGAMYGGGFGFLYFNTYRWVSFKRVLFRKNYGIIYFRTKGRALFPVVKNFNTDVIRTMKGIWILANGTVYRQVDQEKSRLNRDVYDNIDVPYDTKADNQPAPIQTEYVDMPLPKGRFGFLKKDKFVKVMAVKHKVIEEADLDFRQGVPVAYFDLQSMIPLQFADEPPSEISKNPYQVESTLGKEVAAAELEAMKMTKKNMMNAMIIIAVLVILTIALGIMNYINTANVMGYLTYINETMTRIANNQIAGVTPI